MYFQDIQQEKNEDKTSNYFNFEARQMQVCWMPEISLFGYWLMLSNSLLGRSDVTRKGKCFQRKSMLSFYILI